VTFKRLWQQFVTPVPVLITYAYGSVHLLFSYDVIVRREMLLLEQAKRCHRNCHSECSSNLLFTI
jgi:hypothetical protein